MALNGIKLSAGILVEGPEGLDVKYGPFASTGDAVSNIDSTLRYPGLTVGILNAGQVVEYWFKDGVNLVEKTSGGGSSSDLPLLPTNNETHLLLYDKDTGLYWEQLEVSYSPDLPALPAGDDTHLLFYDSSTGLFWEKVDLSLEDAVLITGNQNISGVKNFFDRPQVSGTGVLISGDFSELEFTEQEFEEVCIDNLNFVFQSGNQTISGVKNFISRPTVNGIPLMVSGDASNINAENVVYTTGNASIAGNKNFTTRPTVNNVPVMVSGDASSVSVENVVYTTGNVTISGNKNFISRPTVNNVPVMVSGEQGIVYTTGNVSIDGMKTFQRDINGTNCNMGLGVPYGRNIKLFDQYLAFYQASVDSGSVLKLYNSTNLYDWLTVDHNSNPYQIKILGNATQTPMVAIGTSSPHSSALLDLTSTKGGLLVPRLTQTQKSTISTPATGLVLFNTTSGSLECYNGTSWDRLVGGGAGGSVDTTNLVTTNTVQVISAVKNFTAVPTVNSIPVLVSGDAVKPTRVTATFTTTSITASGTLTSNIDLGCKSYSVLSITAASGAWVKLYYSATDRTNDSTRTVDQDPANTVGLMLESVSTSSSAVRFSPGTIAYNEGTNNLIPIAITNTRSSAATYTISINYLKLEY